MNVPIAQVFRFPKFRFPRFGRVPEPFRTHPKLPEPQIFSLPPPATTQRPASDSRAWPWSPVAKPKPSQNLSASRHCPWIGFPVFPLSRWVRLKVSVGAGSRKKRQRTAALQNASATRGAGPGIRRFWTAAVLCRCSRDHPQNDRRINHTAFPLVSLTLTASLLFSRVPFPGCSPDHASWQSNRAGLF